MPVMLFTPFASEMFAAALGALVGLVIGRKRDTLDERITDITDKVRRPLVYKLKTPLRWFR